MIVTIDSMESNSGLGVGVFSRAGKNNNFQFMVLSSSKPKDTEETEKKPTKESRLANLDIVEEEIKRIEERGEEQKLNQQNAKAETASPEKKKQHRRGASQTSATDPFNPRGSGYSARGTSSFAATSREKIFRLELQKKKVPGFGKYNPKFQ